MTSEPTSTRDTPTHRREHRSLPAWTQLLLLLALCATLFVVGLGDRGLAFSEGLRVGPAWEMLRSGLPWQAPDAWLVPHLFELPYLRKPPGMPWAIAISTSLLGHNETAARLPSAVAMAVLVLVTWRTTTRWLGSPWGMAAGVAQAMLPFFWSSARSAEIEMLHAAGAGAAALLLADAMLRPDARRWTSALGAGLALCVMALAKGPAGLPVVLAVPLAACLATRSLRPLSRPSLIWAAAIPAAILGALALAVAQALARLDDPVITQGVGEFLWDTRRLDRILTLPLVAWGSMLPASAALLVIPWRRSSDNPRDIATRTLALAWLLAIAAYTLLGVSNPRYTLPAATLLPPLAAYAVALASRSAASWTGPRIDLRRRLARHLTLRHPAVWPAILAAGFVAFLTWYEAPRGRTSGDHAGAGLAAILEPAASDSATVWVDDLVECRAEVLLYARAWTPLLHIRWIKPLHTASPRPGDILIVRTDRHDVPQSAPAERDRCAALLTGATLLHEFPVHKYTFEVYRLPTTP